MNCFIKGLLGACVALITIALAALFILPNYSDYRARAKVSEWLAAAGGIKAEVAEKAILNKSVLNSGVGIKTPIGLHTDPNTTITRDGMILIHGKNYGQLLVLIPELSGNFVKWRCLGGSANDVPAECRAK